MAFNLQTATGQPIKIVDNGDGTGSLACNVNNSVDTGYQLSFPGQVLNLSATAQASSAFGTGNGQPAHVRVIGNNPFYLLTGLNPVATSANSAYFGANPAGQILQIPDGYKFSVIQASGGGNVYLNLVTYPNNLV